MNRLSPLIVRRPTAMAGAAAPQLWFAADPAPAASADLEDVKLFAISFLAGLVFFGTYLA